ncbi:unnamed protein product [Amaranthus hypochondriacus]
MGKYVELMVVVISMMSMMVIITGSSEKIIVDELLGNNNNNNNNIIIEGALFQKEINLKCIPNGEACFSEDCCPGNICTYIKYGGFCAWCPTAGYPCGAMSPCCPGLSCDGFFSGTCH